MRPRNVMTGWRGLGPLPAPRKPALADRLGQQRIPKEWAATWLRQYDFRHHTITVRDQDGFAASSETDIFAELVLEDLQID
jgi:hypothetical protein